MVERIKQNHPQNKKLGGYTSICIYVYICIYIYSWWLNQPLWNICSSNWESSSTGRVENKNNIWNHHPDIPSRELTYPLLKAFEDDFPFPQVGYVGSLEGITPIELAIPPHLNTGSGVATTKGLNIWEKNDIVSIAPVEQKAGWNTFRTPFSYVIVGIKKHGWWWLQHVTTRKKCFEKNTT